MKKTCIILVVIILFLLSIPTAKTNASSIKNITVIQDIAIPNDDFIGSLSLAEANLYEEDYNSKYLFPMQGICTVTNGKIAVIDNSYGRIHILDSALDNVFTFGSLKRLIYPTDIAYENGIFYVSDALGGDVQVFGSNGSFMKTLGKGSLNTPTGVAVSSGYIFVSDYFAGRIYKMDTNGNIIKSVSIDYPGGLTSDSKDNIYAVSMSNKTIYKFDKNLRILLTIDGKELLFPSDVAVDMDGNIFVSDRGLSRGQNEQGKIVEYASNGAYIKTIGRVAKTYPNQKDGALLTPAGIAVDRSYNIYVMDAGYYYWDSDSEAPFGQPTGERLTVFSETGIFLEKKDFPQDAKARLTNPTSATLDGKGNIWVVNYGGFDSSELAQFSPSGTFIKRIKELNGKAFPEAFSILSDKKGKLYVGLNGGIAILNENGSLKNMIYDGRLGEIRKIIEGKDGYFYATMFNKDSIVKFDSNGNIIKIIPVCKLPSGIAEDTKGNFYISSIYDNKIHCYNNKFVEFSTIGEGGGRGKMQFYVPEDVGVDKNDDIVVTDTENGRISVFSKGGTLLYQSERIFYEIASIEIEDDTFLVTDCFHNIVRVLLEETTSTNYDFSVSLYPNKETVRPNSKINLTIDIVNTGAKSDTYNISIKDIPLQWSASLSTTTVALSPNEEKKVILSVYTGKEIGTSKVTIEISSLHNIAKFVSANITVSTNLPPELSITDAYVKQGENASVKVVINGAKDIRGISFTLMYNPDNISFIKIEKGHLFNDGLMIYKKANGKILVAVSEKGRAYTSGSGDVAVITLNGKNVSINNLILQNVIVENVLDEKINVSIGKGIFIVKPYLLLNFANGITATNQTFSFTGKVSPGSTLKINGILTHTNPDGTFHSTVILNAKKNIIEAVAIGKDGEETVVKKVVYFSGKRRIVIELQIGNPYMTVNGVKQEIDPGRGTYPVIIKGWDRTVVPIRVIVEALGGEVLWNDKEREVTIQFNGTVINLWINKPMAMVNNVPEWIDTKNHTVCPIIVNDRTFVPIRFVAENLGCTVEWDKNTRTVKITYSG